MLFYIGAERPLQVLRSAGELQAFVVAGEKRAVITRRKFVKDAYAAAPLALHAEPDLAELDPLRAAQPADDDWIAWIVSPPAEKSKKETQQAEVSP